MGVVNAYGRYYVLDVSGIVLECTGSVFPDTVAGPAISGLLMDNNKRVVVVIGEKIPVRDSKQLESMERVLTMLDSVGMLGRISQLDVKNLDNLYLMTTDGAQIVLGDDGSLQTKLLLRARCWLCASRWARCGARRLMFPAAERRITSPIRFRQLPPYRLQHLRQPLPKHPKIENLDGNGTKFAQVG